METLSGKFKDLIQDAVRRSRIDSVVTEQNVYQEGDENVLPLLHKMVETLALPGSGVSGFEHLKDLLEKANTGHSCLLFVEHYSNMDLSALHYLLGKEPDPGKDIANALVAIAGIKLNEENPVVAAFTGAHTRLVIYPSRSLSHLDPVKDRAEIVRSNSINRAAMKALMDIKVKGKLILVFPSGTRYRPWDPSTKKGVREIDSYIKSFDYMCMVAINGELLHIRQGDMMDDFVEEDVIRYTAGPVQSCAEFRNAARLKAEAAGVEDKKQAVVDTIMERLEEMHIAAEAERQRLISS
ncbi:glycerol-3-phosphate O-acyltransferase [Treponema primitia]|uniref:glycerol-3-phosphate O-acyltransferase n=1 Tax=Treponema primitia TaxID=88058 RepID=UPI0002555697|nr:glycerol-3-phosphate O-acyltransferase [Treponema primitia]